MPNNKFALFITNASEDQEAPVYISSVKAEPYVFQGQMTAIEMQLLLSDLTQ